SATASAPVAPGRASPGDARTASAALGAPRLSGRRALAGRGDASPPGRARLRTVPAGARPTDTRPTDARPTDARPTDARPAGARPAGVPARSLRAAGRTPAAHGCALRSAACSSATSPIWPGPDGPG